VINDAQVRTLAYKDIKKAVEGLKEGLFFTIPHLVAYKDSIQNGEGVTEYTSGKAAKELNRLADKLIGVLKPEMA